MMDTDQPKVKPMDIYLEAGYDLYYLFLPDVTLSTKKTSLHIPIPIYIPISIIPFHI